MKMKNRLSTFLLIPTALISLLAISACGQSAESKCREMKGLGSDKVEKGSMEEMVLEGCLKISRQVPDAFEKEYEDWKTKYDKAGK